jgi:Trk K+ transport system NAD-binding subunit
MARPDRQGDRVPLNPEDGAPDPLMIIVGGDALALSTADDVCRLQGHRVVVLWAADGEFARAVARIGARFVEARPDSSEGLERAGVAEAVTILALSPDDRLNLQAVLRARDANPEIRIVLRQFNRTLAHKIAQNLHDCSVLSLAWHSAATYAANAIDPACFRGLQFPEPAGKLTGFVERSAAVAGFAGLSVEEAERRAACRVVAVDGHTAFARDRAIAPEAVLILFGEVATLAALRPRGPEERAASLGFRLRARWRGRQWRVALNNSIVARLALAALCLFLIGMWHFHSVFGGKWLNAAFFVLTTMTTNGYGNLVPEHSAPVDLVATMLLMLSGITLMGLFIAFGASGLTRVQWVRMQGLRRIRRRGHIVVCGAGSIGAGVIDLLLDIGRPLVVIEAKPDPALVERARAERFDLLTGDGSRDETLDLCNLGAAHSLIALTNVDTLNLEIALGARARNAELPIVLRIAQASFAASIARHFAFETTFSAEALAAPAFAGLSRFGGARGRVTFAGQEFAIGEMTMRPDLRTTLAIPLACGRDGEMALVHDVADIEIGECALVLYPLAPFKEGRDTLAAAAQRSADMVAATAAADMAEAAAESPADTSGD